MQRTPSGEVNLKVCEECQFSEILHLISDLGVLDVDGASYRAVARSRTIIGKGSISNFNCNQKNEDLPRSPEG